MDSIYREIVSEALLRRAVIEDHKNELDAIPPDEELNYTFSPRHEAQMKSLFQKEKRREKDAAIFTSLRRAAIIITLIGTLLFGALLTNAEVRATIWTAVTEWFAQFTRHSFNEALDVEEGLHWTFGYLPEGYTESERIYAGGMVYVVYTNNEGSRISLSYSLAAGASIGVDNENSIHEIVFYDGILYDVYAAITNEHPSIIVWTRDGYAFALNGFVEAGELLRMAQSVTLK